MEIFIDLKIRKNTNSAVKPSIIVSPDDTVAVLKRKIIENFYLKSIDPNRIGLTLLKSTNNDEKVKVSLTVQNKTLESLNIVDKCTIIAKDLGYQVGWRMVYIVEYIGPLMIILSMFFLNGHFNNSNPRIMVFIMASFHYLKRILESAFLHEFSRATMPLFNLFVNVTYYWVLFGFFNGYYLFADLSSGIEQHCLGVARYIFAFLFFTAEINNLKCHIILKDLKVKNRGEKGIPCGEGFDYVSCANYFWEFLAWLFFSLFANHFSCYIFTLCGLFIMSKWALEKHRNYKKTFGDKYPKNRKAMLPFIL